MKSTNASKGSYVPSKLALHPPTFMNKVFHHNWGITSTDSGLGSRPEPCGYCGNIHNGFCPRIKKMEYYENGTIKSIEMKEVNYQNNYTNGVSIGGYSGFTGHSGFSGRW